MKQGITTHTIIRNEDCYVWYALNSVIDYVDRMIIYDTGSTDHTREILNNFKNPKVEVSFYPDCDAKKISKLRQKQLEDTKTEWFLILDGDEVWWQQSIQAVSDLIHQAPEKLWGIITPTINCIGDIYHYQEEKAGHYNFAGHTGHLAVRAIRNLPGLHLAGLYPLEGYYDQNNKLVTDYADHLQFLDKPYLHLTNLRRSTNIVTKVISREKKYELGHKFPKNFHYPEVFYNHTPDFAPNPWQKATLADTIKGALQTPFKKIKRRI
jgi:glycosyltransferase involved in cell wall biosynthesis